MLTDIELYGEVMPPIPSEVCNPRINKLKERLEELMSVHYMDRDNSTIGITLKAIDFWSKLRDGQEFEIYE